MTPNRDVPGLPFDNTNFVQVPVGSVEGVVAGTFVTSTQLLSKSLNGHTVQLSLLSLLILTTTSLGISQYLCPVDWLQRQLVTFDNFTWKTFPLVLQYILCIFKYT